MAKELRVRYLVEGSLRAVGKRIRVTVQLIEAESGSHLWAQRFDRSIDEIFDVQDDVVEGIVLSLGGEVYRAEGERVRRRPPESLDAWGLAARATTELGKLGTSGFEEVISLSRRAIELDPDLALPNALLANALAMRSSFSPRDSDSEEALRAAELAMKMTPDDPLVLAYAANALTWLHEADRAVAIVKRAIDLAPNLVTSFGTLAYAYQTLGRAEEAIEYAKRAIEMSPRDLSLGRWYTTMATAYAYAGRWEEANEAATTATERMPDFAAAWVTRAWALLKMGRVERAVAAVRTATELASGYWLAWIFLADALAVAGDVEGAVDAAQVSVDLAPRHWRPWVSLANSLGLAGKDTEAIGAWQQAKSFFPDLSIALVERRGGPVAWAQTAELE